MGRFRVPALRNIAVTAPYMHDGSIATLSEVLAPRPACGNTSLTRLHHDMDIRTLSATRTILGSGLVLGACKSASSDLAEVPASQPSLDRNRNEAVAESPVSEPDEGDTAALPELEIPSADEPAAASPSSEVSGVSAPSVSIKPVPRRPVKKRVRTEVKGEMSCGEGRCG